MQALEEEVTQEIKFHREKQAKVSNGMRGYMHGFFTVWQEIERVRADTESRYKRIFRLEAEATLAKVSGMARPLV